MAEKFQPEGMSFVTPRDIIQSKMQNPMPTKAGRMPPQALEMEQSVLGALLLERDAWERVENVLRPEMFYKEGNKTIFEAMGQLVNSGNPVDMLTVKDHLSKTGRLEVAGGIYYITELTSKVASAANIEYHSRVIVQKYLMRETIKVSDAAVQKGYDPTADVFEVLDEATQALMKLLEEGIGEVTPLQSMRIEGFLLRLKEAQEAKMKKVGGSVIGLTTGLTALDILTEGLAAKCLNIFGARPGMGKTMFLIQMMLANALDGITVGFFSLEMSEHELMMRIAANIAEMDSGKLKAAALNDHDWAQLIEKLQTKAMKHMIICDESGMSIATLKRKAKYMVRKQGAKLILVDYLGLVTSANPNPKFNDDQKTAKEVSRGLKDLAKELGVPVVALSQLNRGVEETKLKRPSLSDLRESGSIEQDADFVGFLYRPAYYYDSTEVRKYYAQMLDEDYARMLLILVAKQRSGSAGLSVAAEITLAESRITDIKSQRWLNSIGAECSWMTTRLMIERMQLVDDLNPDYRSLFTPAEIVGSNTQGIVPSFDLNGNPKTANDNDRSSDFPF